MRFLSTIFVIAMTLTACTGNNDNSSSNSNTYAQAVGVDSKVGRALSAKELCAELKVDGLTGENTVEAIQFRSNSVFVRRTLAINAQVQYVVKAKSRGYWGLLNNMILMNENGKRERFEIKEIENGTRTCFQIGAGDASSTYCPCN